MASLKSQRFVNNLYGFCRYHTRSAVTVTGLPGSTCRKSRNAYDRNLTVTSPLFNRNVCTSSLFESMAHPERSQNHKSSKRSMPVIEKSCASALPVRLQCYGHNLVTMFLRQVTEGDGPYYLTFTTRTRWDDGLRVSPVTASYLISLSDEYWNIKFQQASLSTTNIMNTTRSV